VRVSAVAFVAEAPKSGVSGIEATSSPALSNSLGFTVRFPSESVSSNPGRIEVSQ